MPTTIAVLESYPIVVFYMTGKVKYQDVVDSIVFMQTHVTNRNLQSLYSVIHMHNFEMSHEDMVKGAQFAAKTSLSHNAPYLLTPLAVGDSPITKNTLKTVKENADVNIPALPSIEDAYEFARWLHDLRGGKA